MRKQPYVIIISGDSGAGKTTLIHNLVSLLGDAVFLLLDDHAEDAIYPPAREWLKNGANPEEFITPTFVNNLKSLREGRSIVHPESKLEIHPAPYIFIEEPFGRSRSAMRPLIDLHIHLQIPPEVALARRVLRNINRMEKNPNSEGIKEFLDWYLRAGRDFFTAVRERSIKDADVILDGQLPQDVLAQKITQIIQSA